MATFRKNSITHGASGSFGTEFAFRQVNGKTILVPLPRRRKKATPAQLAERKKFQNACIFAKAALANPLMKAEYTAIAQRKNFRGGAMVAAMTDYLTTAQLAHAHAYQFDGSMGFPISIVLVDNYKGREMTVSVSNKDGTIIESGKASFTFGNSAWSYTTTTAYQNIDGLTVMVTVKDRVGRVAAFEKVINSLE